MKSSPRNAQATGDKLSSAAGNAELDQFLASVEAGAYRLVLSACRDPDEAVDLLQDAMTQLVTRYRHRNAEEWAPLFHRIVQNRIRDWYRKRKVKHALLRWTGLGDTTQQVENIKSDSRHNPDSIHDSNHEREKINKAIEQLPLRQQQTFLLRAWQELSVDETAQAMGISAGSVKTHYSRALKSLRLLLVSQEDDE